MIQSTLSQSASSIQLRFTVPSFFKLSPTTQSAQKKQDFLWKSTCFELFIFEKNAFKYQEFNFSLTGDWNHYTFRKYRVSTVNPHQEAPFSALSSNASENSICFQLKKKFFTHDDLVKPCCILQEPHTQQLHYFAPWHPPSQEPDFHSPQAAQEIAPLL